MRADLLDVSFEFGERPGPIPAILRPDWRIASLLLCLNQCRGGKANRKQLHVLNWAARNAEAQTVFIDILNGILRPDDAIVRFDPVLDRAVHFASGEKLIVQSGDSIVMTEKGGAFVEALMDVKDCMVQEKSFLKRIGRKITQTQVEALV